VLRALWVGATGAFLWTWGAMGRDRRERQRVRRVTLPFPAAEGVTFHGDVILVRSGGSVTALSSRCPHLGCRIERSENGSLCCPCHGSRFDPGGKRLAGPADHDLERLVITPSREARKLDVDTSG
jgi:Rieske Fe-S protein